MEQEHEGDKKEHSEFQKLCQVSYLLGLSVYVHCTYINTMREEVRHLNRSGTRCKIKTITNQQLILNLILSLVKTVRHCFTNFFYLPKHLVHERF